MQGKRRRQKCAPEGKDSLNGDHRATWTYSSQCVIPHVLEVTKPKGPLPSLLYLLLCHGFGGGVKMSWKFSLWTWQGSSARWIRCFFSHFASREWEVWIESDYMCALRLPETLEYWCLDTKRNVELNPAFSLAQYWSLNRKSPNHKPETISMETWSLAPMTQQAQELIILLSFLQLHSLMVLRDPQLLQLIVICHLWLNNTVRRISLTEVLCSHLKNNT